MADRIASVISDDNRCLNLEKQIKFLLSNNLTEAVWSLGQHVFSSMASFWLFSEYFASISNLRLSSTSALGFTATLGKNIGLGRLRATFSFPKSTSVFMSSIFHWKTLQPTNWNTITYLQFVWSAFDLTQLSPGWSLRAKRTPGWSLSGNLSWLIFRRQSERRKWGLYNIWACAHMNLL